MSKLNSSYLTGQNVKQTDFGTNLTVKITKVVIFPFSDDLSFERESESGVLFFKHV